MNEIKSINNIPIHDTVARASIAKLEDKINNIEDNIDLSEYATKDYVDRAIENVDVDLTDYATKDEVPTKVSQLANDNDYITNADLEEQNYAHKYDLPISVSELLNDRGYLTEADVNRLLENINTEDLSHVFLTQEEYNALTNEEKNDESKLYIITDADEVDISSYATKAYVDEAIENIDVGDIDLSGYATTSYIDNLIGDVGALLDTLNGEVI